MARHNYQYEKRQKDLARRRKKEEKRQRKLDKKRDPSTESAGPAADESNAE